MNVDELIADPIFQLNSIIWSLVDAPKDGFARPLLRELGYSLFSLSQPLNPDQSVRPAIFSWLGNTQPPKAEAVAAHADNSEPWLVFECKATSFSPESTTAGQARKYLAISPILGSSLALGMGASCCGDVVYVTAEDAGPDLLITLVNLRGEAAARGISSAHVAVLSLAARDGEIHLLLAGASRGTSRLMTLAKGECLLAFEPGIDPRPLYYIPWDPGVDQTTEFAKHGKQILVQRCIIYAISQVRRAKIKESLVIDGADLVCKATNNLAKKWRSASDLREMSQTVVRVMAERLSRSKKHPIVFANSGSSITMTIPTEGIRKIIADLLLKGDVEPSARDPIIELQTELFDLTDRDDKAQG